MSPLWNPKSLSEWQELDYHRRPRPLKSLWRPVLLATLAVAVVALVAVAALQKRVIPRLATAYQAGPLSTAHAMFNNDCSRCHVEGFKTWDRLVHSNSAIRAVSNDTCEKCHLGPQHHPDVVRGESIACVSCHREHHGQGPISRVADGSCTSCHRDLPRSIEPGAHTDFRKVTTFADHPEFAQRWLGAPQDPGTVAFNHARHLPPDGVLTYFAEQQEKLRGPEPEKDRRTQRKQLQCSDCHVPDEAGRYMLPINYEKHCKECHPLTVSIPIKAEGAVKKDLAEFSQTPAPHQKPEVVRAALRDRLTRFIQANNDLLQTEPKGGAVPRPIPGSKPSAPAPVSKEQFEWVNQQLGQVEKPLLASKAGCAFCHQEDKAARRPEGGLPSFAPSQITQRWFPHSRFRHDGHRMLDCTQCHDAPSSQRTSDVLLPGIDNCRNCHNNRPGASARSDCAECHTYHPADQKRSFRGRLNLEEVLGPRSP
jgi:hypothetical protein